MLETAGPVLRSDLLTAGAALAIAAVGASLPIAFRGRTADSMLSAAAAGLAYGLCGVGLWFGVRIAVGRHPPALWPSLDGFLFVVGVGVVVLGLQAAIPHVLFVRRTLIAPLVCLFVGTAFAALLFLHVGGESDALFIYAFVYGPVVIAGELLSALLETVVRATVVDRFVPA
ncbi:hypothetical protein [Halopiger thermotolerans]